VTYIMRWQQTEFIFKGVFLGLVLFVGLELHGPNWGWDLAQIGFCTFGTLVLFLGVTTVRKLIEGYRVRGRLGAFVLFLLLENPGMVFAGVILGMLLGTASLFGTGTVPDNDTERYRLLWCVLGGIALGLTFNVLYHVQSLQARRWYAVALGAAMIAGTIYLLPQWLPLTEERVRLATLLLLGIPVFYLLTLASMTEESEVEITAICAALGVSLWILSQYCFPENDNLKFVILLVPPTIYYLYTRRILPGLRVFKHVLRGISYANVGQIRPALISLGRAMQLDPSNQLAREQLWRVHRLMDFTKVVNEPETLALLNFDLCVERVATLLLAGVPKPEHLEEAHRLLDLVSNQRPAMQAHCDYWRALALTHERRLDEAAASLERVLTGEGVEAGNPHRRAVLFQAWHLALMAHGELERRVGQPQLAVPGRRMQAIAATERRLATAPEDAHGRDLKRFLYDGLNEDEYRLYVIEGKAPEWFDHAYAHQLGLAQIGDAARWERGCEYLRIAATGLPAQAPSILLTIARAHEKAGNFGDVWHYYELIKKVGHAVGPANLTDEDRHTYFAVVKTLGEDAAKRGDNVAALECFKLFADYERAGINTYRTLAELYERAGQPWNALYAATTGLVYDSADQDLLDRKDRYYYSVTPEELQPNLERVHKWFDVAYCKQKAKWLLDNAGENLELLDWAEHLAALAQVAEPASYVVRLLRARLLRRRGENDKAAALLEEVRNNKPEKFPSGEEEEAWFLGCRLLGDLYLNTKPDQAIGCYQEYRKHGKSGADTVYKMGVAYENLGNFPMARKCYETVAAYEGHPLAPDANSALHRLQASA
jgi:hypothetical protein